MQVISVYFGQPCDIDCIYCKRNYYHDKKKHARTFEQIMSEIKEAINKQGEGNYFFLSGGGEPTELPEFFEVCEFLKKHNSSFILETNGLKLANRDYLRKLIDLGLNNLNITICSMERETYNKIIGGLDYYDHMIAALKNVEKEGINITIHCVIQKDNLHNFHEIPEVINKEFPELKAFLYFFHLVRINSPLELFNNVAFKLSEHCEDIERKLIKLKEDGHKITLSTGSGTFPFCFFKDLVKAFEYDKIQFNKDEMRLKTSYCKGCKKYENCPGISHTYIDLYGEEEFKGRKFT
ncbi:MAG TPA: radical SAM protein [Candidatus Woesearchaeota archaeon]|nr:radical SAM protein [Candidatus Woesearchaeota archaeon]